MATMRAVKPPSDPAPLVAPVKAVAPIEALLLSVLKEQARQGAKLDAILQLLERGRGARDAADVALLLAVAEAIGDRPFLGAQLMTHADADPALREALTAADIDDAQQLGCVLRRLDGITLHGLRLERVDAGRLGVRWRVQVCEVEPRILAGADTREP